MIELRTIGSLEVTRSGEGDVSAQLTQPKRLALLVYLATARPRGFHRRDTLLALFWPELDSRHARGALSQALRHLREVLGPGVVVTRGRGEVGVDPAGLWCDVIAFETSASKGDAENALALYRGDFLQGVHVSGVVEFERWMEGERARLRDLAARLAWMLAEREERAGIANAAGYWARCAAALTLNDEIAVRRHVALLHRVGDRAGAVAVYDEFARRFKADYSEAPSLETQAFIHELRARAPEKRAGQSTREPQRGAALEQSSVSLGDSVASDHQTGDGTEADETGGQPISMKHVATPDGATRTTATARSFSLADARAAVAPHTPRSMTWALAGVAVGVLTTLVITGLTRSQRQAQSPSRLDLVLPHNATPHVADFGEFGSIALSPEGSAIVYIGGPARSLFLRALDEPLPQRLEGTDGATCPSFSPDGRWIAFIAKGHLNKVAVRGGPPITIADSAAGCGVWTDRSEIVFNRRGSLYRVRADGGSVSVVTAMDWSKRIGVMIPSHALPGGNDALICVSEDGRLSRMQLGVVSLQSGRVTRLTEGAFSRCPARYTNGYVVFGENRRIFAAPFSLRSHEFTGPPVALFRDTVASFGTAANGTLAYVAATPRAFSLVAVGEGGKIRTVGGKADDARLRGSPPTPLDTGLYAWPRLSPDGKRVVMEMLTAGQGGTPPGDLWVYDIASGTVSRLTTNSTGIQPLGWTADSRSVVFIQIDSGNIGGPRRVMTQPWDGSASARELIRFPERFSGSINTMFDFSIDRRHRYAAFVVGNFSDTADILIAPLDTPSAARPLVATRAREFQARLSPAANLVAYTSNETGRDEVYIRSFLGPPQRLQVSADGGWQPLWSADGRHLYYRAPGYMMRATISRRAAISVVRSDTLFRDGFNQHDVVNYDVFPGGKELLMIRTNAPGQVHAAVVLNWPGLRQRATMR